MCTLIGVLDLDFYENVYILFILNWAIKGSMICMANFLLAQAKAVTLKHHRNQLTRSASDNTLQLLWFLLSLLFHSVLLPGSSQACILHMCLVCSTLIWVGTVQGAPGSAFLPRAGDWALCAAAHEKKNALQGRTWSCKSYHTAEFVSWVCPNRDTRIVYCTANLSCRHTQNGLVCVMLGHQVLILQGVRQMISPKFVSPEGHCREGSFIFWLYIQQLLLEVSSSLGKGELIQGTPGRAGFLCFCCHKADPH